MSLIFMQHIQPTQAEAVPSARLPGPAEARARTPGRALPRHRLLRRERRAQGRSGRLPAHAGAHVRPPPRYAIFTSLCRAEREGTLTDRAEFWAIGYKLFKDTPATFPATFIPGDAFDDAFLAPAPIASQPPPTPPPALAALTTLTPLHGRLSAIHASSFFHLFNEPQQLALARRLASLLSPAPGSLILGAHVGRPEKGARVESVRVNTQGVSMFCHSAESWAEMWTTEVFGPGEVKVDATLREVERVDIAPGSKSWALVWSVTRL